MTEEVEVTKPGKPWNVVSRFNSFVEADAERTKLKSLWESENKEGMEVKVKKTPSGVFTVRTRLHPDFEVKSNKKQKKPKKVKKED